MEKSIRKITVMMVLLTLTSFGCPVQNESYVMTINVNELRNSDGVVQFTFYHKEGSIPDQKFKAFYKMEKGEIINGAATITFNDLPKGRYAIIVLHDENEIGKIYKGFILPIEGFGFSNHEAIGLSIHPNFSKASFEFSSDTTVVVKMIYK